MFTLLKKTLLISICTAMLVSIAACGDNATQQNGDSETTTSAAQQPDDTEEQSDATEGQPDETDQAYTLDDISADAEPVSDPLGRYDETVEVSTIHRGNDGGFWFAEGEDIGNNIYTQTWNEILNVDYSLLWTSPSAQSDERFNLMMTSGDLPDMMAVNRREFNQLYEAGLLEDLTDAVVEYASQYSKTFLSGDFLPLQRMAVHEERLYGIPGGYSYQDSSEMLWIRADWLENLNLDTPSNLSELENVMRAFVEDDPNQSGQADTYAFSYSGGSQGAWQWGAPAAFFNMFDVYPGIFITEGSQGLQCGMFGAEQRDKTRDAISRLKDYYDSGYINADYLTFDEARYHEDLVSGRAGIVFGHLWYAWWPLNMSLDLDPNADWVPIQIPGADGGTASTPANAISISSINVVTKGFSNPEALVKMSNLFHDLNNNPETMRFSEFNVWPEDNNQIFLAYPLTIGDPAWNYTGYLAISEAFETGDTSVLSEAYQLFYDQVIDYAERKDISGWPSYRSYTSVGCMEVVHQNIIQKTMKMNEYTGEPTQHMLDNASTVKTIYDEMIVNVVSSNTDITQFDAFLEQYDALYYNVAKQELDQWFADNDYYSIQAWFEQN